MASFTLGMTEFSDENNRRTFMVTGHTVQKPKLVIQKRSVPKTPNSVGESQLMVVYGTDDASGAALASKVNFTASVRYPADGTAADVTAALAAFRDLVASDEFTSMVNTQAYMK